MCMPVSSNKDRTYHFYDLTQIENIKKLSSKEKKLQGIQETL